MTESTEQRNAQSHPQTPSHKLAAHLAAIHEHVVRTDAEREQRIRERRDATEYHRATEPTEKGS